MKHDVVKKLYSRRGAAIIIALLVFLIAALSGTVALTMAASNAGRYTHEKKDQQAYLSVVSAANIILDRLEDVEIEYTAEHGYPQLDDEVTVNYTTTGQRDLFLADEAFTKCLQAYSISGIASFDFSLSATDAGMGTVSVSVYIYSGGTFNFRLYSVDGDNRDYQITMQVGTTFSDGVGNFVEDSNRGLFYRRMKFDMNKVTYVVEAGY